MPGTDTDDIGLGRRQHLLYRLEFLQVQIRILIDILSPSIGDRINDGDNLDIVDESVAIHMRVGDRAATDDGGSVFCWHVAVIPLSLGLLLW